MKHVTRTTKLIVLADGSGQIRSAMWPGVQTEGAPTYVGMNIPAGHQVHEVDVPKELYEAARPSLSDYVLENSKGGPATLVRRGAR